MKIFKTPKIARTRKTCSWLFWTSRSVTTQHGTGEVSPSARLGLPVDITLDVWHRRTSRADLATHKPNSSTLIYPFVLSELMFGVINFTLESGF